MDTFIGVITPEGVIASDKRKVSLTDIEVYEYGFSKALLDLCPKSWKELKKFLIPGWVRRYRTTIRICIFNRENTWQSVIVPERSYHHDA